MAIAAPKTSFPFGSSTNINRGSKTIFRIAPMVMPKLAVLDWPVLRIKWAKVADRTVGMPPITIVTNVYDTA